MGALEGTLGYTIILVILELCQQKTRSYEIRCPKQTEWSLKARAKCGNVLEYFCVLDDNVNIYTEFCKRNPDIARDITWKKGQKCVFRGNLDGEVCSEERYQPFKFRTDGNSDCAYKKSFCREEGMINYNNGTTTLDTQCRCDHTKGFAFVSITKQNCVCIPSQEDCSCYKKTCKGNTKLSSDYNCIFLGSREDKSACSSFDIRPSENSGSKTPALKQSKTDTMMVVERSSLFNFIITAAILVFTVIISMLFWKRRKSFGKLQLTDEKLNKKFEQWTKQKFVNQRMAGENLEERLEQWSKRKLNDQEAFETKVKEQSSNYKDIIIGINTTGILEKLSRNKWMTDSEKNSINEFHGRRQKNKALLELVFNREFNGYTHFIYAIGKSHSNNGSELVKKIENLKDFLEEKSNNEKKPKNVKDLEEFLINDKIPKDVRNVFETYFKTWYKDDERFTVTKATCEIEKNLEQNNCVLVVGRSGKGKSAIIRHIALKLYNEEGYDVVPIVLDLSTIFQYHDPNRKQLFVLDDFCGKVETNDQTLQMWSVNIYEVMELIKNPINADGSVKLLFATQPFLFKNSSFNSVDCLSNYKVYLSEFPLENQEKIDMIKKYLPKDHAGNMPILSRHNEDIVPLLCKLSEGKTAKQMKQLFKNPDQVIKKDFFALKHTNKKQICLLSLCVLFKSLTKDMFSHEYTSEKDEIIKLVCSEFNLDFSEKNTKSKLQAELTYLEKTYFVKSGDTYYFVHKDIYNIAAVSCGEMLKNIFIRFAYSSFIAERYSFVSPKTDGGDNSIYLDNKEVQKRYFDRLRNDLEQGITYSTFHNSQLKNEAYRVEFCTYCIDRKQIIVKILNFLQKRVSEPPSNRHDTPIAPRKVSHHDYEDYIDYQKSWNFSSHNMKMPLIESAWEGHVEIVNMLIDLERDVDETDKFGRSALCVACYRGKKDVVQLLLKKKADLSKCDGNEKSPLYAACKGGHTDIVKCLLDKGAITSKCDKDGYSPLHVTSAEGHRDILKLLLPKTNVDKCNYFGRSALFVASNHGRRGIVKLLLKENANINDCDLKGFSPLMAACSRGFLHVVDALINAKPKDIKINDQDVEGRTALFIASKKGHDEIVKFLLSHKADVFKLDCHQQSPLFIASSFGHEKVVKLLVNYDATISISDEEEKTPLFIACEKGQEIVVDILLQKCSPEDVLKTDSKQRSPLYVASSRGFIGIVKKLTGKDAQTNVWNKWDETPLFAASRGGHVKVVGYLIDNNADLNHAESNGHTPLWIASDEGNFEIVKMLAEKGAAINHQDNEKRTPLFAASKGNHIDVVRYLVDKKADLNSAESNGQTPLGIACDEGHVEIVKILVDKEADINLQDNDNRKPLDVALIRGNTDIENILKQKVSTDTKTVNTNVKE